MRDRIVELRRVPASELRPTSANWRLHPASQRAALTGMLERIGIIDAVIARETPEGLELIDGHLRTEIAADAVLPVIVVDLDEIEAAEALATHDPLGAMAETDDEKLTGLLADISDTEDLGEVLERIPNLRRRLDVDLAAAVEALDAAPAEAPAPTHLCPACGHEW